MSWSVVVWGCVFVVELVLLGCLLVVFGCVIGVWVAVGCGVCEGGVGLWGGCDVG